MDTNSIFKVKIRISELIFDGDECKEILKFFFTQKHDYIDQLEMTDQVRALSHAFLIEAIDKSYAFGIVSVVFNNFFLKPSKGFSATLAKFSKGCMGHWLDNVNRTDLTGEIRIYEWVRQQIESNFNRMLEMIINDVNEEKPYVSTITYQPPKHRKPVTIWRNM